MKVYEVVSSFFDNGKVAVSLHTYELDQKPENKFVETKRCDRYHDYFTNKNEAYKHYDDAKRA